MRDISSTIIENGDIGISLHLLKALVWYVLFDMRIDEKTTKTHICKCFQKMQLRK